MKKILSILLAAVLLLSLTACGGGGDKEDPTLGIYEGVSVVLLGEETPMTEVYPGDNSLELKAGGKAVFTLDSDAIDCKWELDGKNLTVDIEGEECTGTLEDGVIELDFMGMMDMIFAKDGAYESGVSGKTDGGSKLGGLDAAETGSEEQGIAGYYKVDSMEMDGETMDLAMLEMAGMADMIYLVLEEDGTGRMCFEEEAEITYDDTQIYAGEEGAPYTLDGDTITIEIENVKVMLVRSDETPPEPGAAPVEGAFPEEFAAEMGGDWHGWVVVSEGTGELADYSNQEFEIIARLVFHEDGTCSPYLASPLSDNAYNFSNISGTYNEYGEVMMLEGELFQAQIVDSSNAYVWDDVLYIDLYLEDGAGGELTLNAGLRYLHEDWDYSTDYPALPEDAVAYYQSQGMDFLEMVEFYGLDTSDVPEWTDSFTEGAPVSSGGSPTANPGFSGPTAEYDYGEKGMIFFDYPSDTYTYEKKFGVDTLKANDGSLKITFVASWDMEEYAKTMEGYEKYVSESGGVIEDGLSYGGNEAVRCTWENVIGDVTVETYILFNESYGDYVGVNVIATAPSQSSLDANSDVIEAILHSVRP